ncbi:N-acetyltransferase, partial [Salmonella enterica subsp. enterica]|nr:N-acetyltransferase [Salmonella enterica subsp. enterica serovar Typhimurium]EAA2714593.1 N-acetyltransferase [Salmonella enterica subsp. enterica serovar Coeln]EBO3847077.1 GNAT family N-acetyltransferase [Salmonella enterica]ECW4383506.1 GNAT family N-acetyltransferase [Salmonella enterica subsp. enterica serovar Enteritidis]HCK7355046.1 GNAT family N-acetyltransferase [Klebsiella pneumoniae]
YGSDGHWLAMSSNGRHFGEIRLSALKKAPEMFGSVYEHEEKKPMEAFAERLRDAVAFGAYIDGEIIGLSVFKQEDGPKDAHKAHLSGVFVEPEQRGRGVAGMLLRAVIDYGREHVEQIMLTVAEGNEAAINLYQRSARCPAPLQSPRRSAGRQSK